MRETARETEKEIKRERHKKREREIVRKREKELHAHTSRKCRRAESLGVPHSVSQSACVIIILMRYAKFGFQDKPGPSFQL